MRFVILGLAVLASCGGGRENDNCRDTSDCTGELECAGVNDAPACGIPPREDCASDADCNGDRCHAVIDPCSPDAIGSQCGPPCSDDAPCESDFACNDGSCVALRCDDGFTCPARQTCDPDQISDETPVFDRHHGCFDVACDDDGACDGRFCVNGICQDDVGTCQPVIAVP